MHTQVTKVRSTVTLDTTTGAVIRRADGGGRISSMDELDVQKDVKFLALSKNDSIPNTEVYLSIAKLSHPKTSSLRVCLRNAQIVTASQVSSGLNAFTVVAGSNVQNLLEELDSRFATSDALKKTSGSALCLYTHPSLVVGGRRLNPGGASARGIHARFVVDGTLPEAFHFRSGKLADVYLKLKGGVVMDRFVSLLWVVEHVVVPEESDESDDEEVDEEEEAGCEEDAGQGAAAEEAKAEAAAAAAAEEDAAAKERRNQLRLKLSSMIDEAVDDADISRIELAIKGMHTYTLT
jgi:hypothetical protein